MPDFNPTHRWRMRLGSAGEQSTPVVLVAVVEGDRGALASVRTRGGNTYLAHTDELDPMARTKTATFVKQRNGNGDGRVYRCDPPMMVHRWSTDAHDEYECDGTGDCTTTEYVWISAASVLYSGPETYVFPCTPDGEVTDWGELRGSFKGSLDHAQALLNAGYEVTS